VSLLEVSKVIPVVVLEDAADAVPLARALLDGGVPIVEVTLRTPTALDAVRAIADEVPDMLVGAGTVLTAEQAKAATAAGARFLVSPGNTERLLDAFGEQGLPFLPGAATPSEMMRLLERGITEAKFFPAVPAGGVELLRAIYGPLPQLRFSANGGITARNMADFLALPNVACVGGSWITPADTLAARDWATITRLAREIG
jgi:2-dehydro-3-deoxyphosphogluconate aldolase/(4S)-4-hydroxy-2-oxoglutarate aldolase